jgi:hypothetical protein
VKTIIAGSRDKVSYQDVVNAIKTCPWTMTEVVCGKARGADTFGETYAYNASIPVKEFPADWKGLGKAAGPIRNAQMGDYADALIAVWDGESRGTKNMIDYATKKGLKIHIHIIKDDK